tara:strand:+ start:762 stop:1136 length:375 start_codon:yes stop_codon:yes gene_type:complete
MPTPLNKPVQRLVELNGEKYLASLQPETEQHPASFALRKMRSSKTQRTPIESLLTGELDTPKAVETNTRSSVSKSDPAYTVAEIKSKIAINPMDYKLKVEVLRAVDDLLEVEDLLEGETCTLNL